MLQVPQRENKGNIEENKQQQKISKNEEPQI